MDRLIELFRNAGVVAWPLGLFAALSAAVIIERIFTLSKLKAMEDRAFVVLQLALENRDDSALRDAAIAQAPVCQVMSSLTTLRGASEEMVQETAAIALSMQRLRLRKYLGTLATIGSTSPFVGLFGTVLGVMAAFRQMSQTGLGSERMAGGISEALSATALGLLVAIPSVMAYNALLGRVQGLLLVVQGHVARLVPIIAASTHLPSPHAAPAPEPVPAGRI